MLFCLGFCHYWNHHSAYVQDLTAFFSLLLKAARLPDVFGRPCIPSIMRDQGLNDSVLGTGFLRQAS